MSSPATLTASASVISLPESAAGPKPCALPVGPPTNPSGRGLVPVNRFRVPENALVRKMNGTSGRNFTVLSASVTLQQYLANRLQARMDLNGSMEYRLTWKNSVMPSGRVISRLRASGRRISDKEVSGWPTAKARDHHREGKGQYSPSLAAVAQLAGWTTPTLDDANNRKAKYAQGGTSLSAQTQLAGWGTPACRDHKDGSSDGTVKESGLLGRQVWGATPGATTSSSTSGTEKRGALNPALSRWLMGYRDAWDSCGATAMQSCQKWQRSSSRRSKRPHAPPLS